MRGSVTFSAYKEKIWWNNLWAAILGVTTLFAFSPIPYDPLPFVPPIWLVGAIAAVAAILLFFVRRFRLQYLATIAMAREGNNNSVMLTHLMSELGINEKRAVKILDRMRQGGIMRIERIAGPQGEEVEIFRLCN